MAILNLLISISLNKIQIRCLCIFYQKNRKELCLMTNFEKEKQEAIVAGENALVILKNV